MCMTPVLYNRAVRQLEVRPRVGLIRRRAQVGRLRSHGPSTLAALQAAPACAPPSGGATPRLWSAEAAGEYFAHMATCTVQGKRFPVGCAAWTACGPHTTRFRQMNSTHWNPLVERERKRSGMPA